MDHLRRASGHPSAVPVPVEDRAIEAITTEEALTLIASLPRDQAEAVLLRAVVGLDAKGGWSGRRQAPGPSGSLPIAA